MNSDDIFWLGVWITVVSGIVAIVIVSTTYYQDKTQKMADLIDLGADPVAVSCAINDEYGKNPICIIKALQ